MDKHDIRRRALAARQIGVEVEPGISITLQLPTRQEVAVQAARAGVHRPGDETAALVVLQRALLLAAVVGWGRGVTLRHLLPDEPAEPLAFDADLVPLLLDAKPGWEDTLVARFAQARRERAAEMEDASGNSSSALPGSAPEAMRMPNQPVETMALTGPSTTGPSGPH